MRKPKKAALPPDSQADSRYVDIDAGKRLRFKSRDGRKEMTIGVESFPNGNPPLDQPMVAFSLDGNTQMTLGADEHYGPAVTMYAQDGSPRIELFVAPNGTPQFRMMDDTGAVRLAARVGDMDEDAGDITWAASVSLYDGLGSQVEGDTKKDCVEASVGVNFLSLRACVAGLRIMDHYVDGRQLADGVRRRETAATAARQGGRN